MCASTGTCSSIGIYMVCEKTLTVFVNEVIDIKVDPDEERCISTVHECASAQDIADDKRDRS